MFLFKMGGGGAYQRKYEKRLINAIALFHLRAVRTMIRHIRLFIRLVEKKKKHVFSRVHATLHLAVSVGPSVGPSHF